MFRSTSFHNFVKVSLTKNPKKRPTAEKLLLVWAWTFIQLHLYYYKHCFFLNCCVFVYCKHKTTIVNILGTLSCVMTRLCQIWFKSARCLYSQQLSPLQLFLKKFLVFPTGLNVLCNAITFFFFFSFFLFVYSICLWLSQVWVADLQLSCWIRWITQTTCVPISTKMRMIWRYFTQSLQYVQK